MYYSKVFTILKTFKHQNNIAHVSCTTNNVSNRVDVTEKRFFNLLNLIYFAMTVRLQTLKGLGLYLKSFGGILDPTTPLSQAVFIEDHVKMDSFDKQPPEVFYRKRCS